MDSDLFALDTPVPVLDSRELPPAPGLLDLIGRNHNITSALADIVDNSIDARATTVLIRFLRKDARLVSVVVVDDGDGMDDTTIDQAMTIGATRSYGEGSLGHFGIGLKAASLGQAGSVTVLSRNRSGVPAVGRRLASKRSDRFECDVVDPTYASNALDRDWRHVSLAHGTVVKWDGVRTFPHTDDPTVTDQWIDETVRSICEHLGLVFHRLIAAGRVKIVVDVEDIATTECGLVFTVDAINPFGYSRTGHPDYPRSFTVSLAGRSATLRCHIWPARSTLTEFKLGSVRTPHSGIYVYRGDRLIQAGGWHGTTPNRNDVQLARVEIDIDAVISAFSMNPEKTAVQASAEFSKSLASFVDGSWSFVSYLDDAAQVLKQARRWKAARKRVVPPGRGFAPKVRSAIGAELEFLPGEDPIDIRWADMDGDDFFNIDRVGHVIALNKNYRWALTGESGASLNDAPVVKAFAFLLLEPLFRDSHLGPRDKDNIALWQEILLAAARAQQEISS
jgi:hypothetical protein